MYFDTSILRSQRATSFQRLLPKLGSQALQRHVLSMFLFAAKMAADTNQLKELCEFLRAGNEDSARTRVCLTMKTTDLKRFTLRFL